MIKEQRDSAETNIIWFEKDNWKVFTSDFDFPAGWTHQGWRISSQCDLGYTTTIWKTTDKSVVQRDLAMFDITKEAFEKSKP